MVQHQVVEAKLRDFSRALQPQCLQAGTGERLIQREDGDRNEESDVDADHSGHKMVNRVETQNARSQIRPGLVEQREEHDPERHVEDEHDGSLNAKRHHANILALVGPDY
eukprot:2934885-Prymnesium_polylepis.1